MAQTWDSTVPSTTTNIFTDNVNSRSNEESLRSNFSGTSYPLTPVQGQTCYRTDLGIEFTFNGSIWVESNSTSTISNEVKLSRGSLTSLDDRLSVSINPDGTLKSDIDLNISEFIISGLVPTYVSTSSFTVPEDQTGVFTAGRMLRASLATSYVYSNISTSVYNSSPNTTTVTLKDAVLDSGLNKLAYTVIQKTNAESLSNIPAGNISSTNVQAAINELDDKKLGKAGGTMAGSLILAENPTENLQAATKQYVDINSGGGSVGVTNYIASGGKFGTPSGFVLPIESRVESISDKKITRTASDLTLNARKKALIYDTANGTTDKLEAVYPTAYIDNNTVGFWIFNQPVGSVVPNSAVGLSSIAVANDLIPSGTTTRVDGLADYALKSDGLAATYLRSANYTGFPTGASERELMILATIPPGDLTGYKSFMGNGTAASNGLSVGLLAGVIEATDYTTTWSSVYSVDSQGKYLIDVRYDGSIITINVNGKDVYSSGTVTLATVASVYTFFSTFNASQSSASTLHFAEIRNKCRTSQEIAEIAAELLFPISWTDTDGVTRKNLTSILPTDSISLGYAYAGSSGITDTNDSWWGYGRREKAYGGNRKVFLGWKYFSGSPTLTWTNPFGTRKVRSTFAWAQDENGRNESSPVPSYASTYGTQPGPTTTNLISTQPGTGGFIYFNGAWQTSGYIGCYAEVLEDD